MSFPEGLRLSTVLATGLAVALIGWEIARLTPITRPGVLSLIDAVFPLAYVPLPFLIGWALLAGRPLAAGILAVPLLLYVVPLALTWWPNPAPPPTTGSVVRVITANVYYRNDDVSAFVELLRREQPDVIGVQELGAPFAEALLAQLGDDYPYRFLYPRDTTRGMGVLSRLPATELAAPRMARGESADQVIELQVDGQPWVLVNVHPLPYFASRARTGDGDDPNPLALSGQEETFASLLAVIDEHRDRPVVLTGDLNVSDRQHLYNDLARRLTDSWRAVGNGPGWTLVPWRNSFLPPLLRIDYIFVSDELAAMRAAIHRLPGSDHWYVVADVARRAG